MLQREEMKLQKCKLHTEISGVVEYRNYHKKREKDMFTGDLLGY